VLHEGQVQEYDTPSNLLAKPGSSFRGMVEETARHSVKQGSSLVPTRSAQDLAAVVARRLSADGGKQD
jgi:ABC-type proline/glycine betaine transport system ATPase subunit